MSDEDGGMRHGLSLYMVPMDGGYSYQWEDGHGKVWCSGWHDGSVIEVAEAANAHLDGAMNRTPCAAETDYGGLSALALGEVLGVLADETETVPRPLSCQCQWEQGDSPCPVHGEDEDHE